jgi:hypothetical protein
MADVREELMRVGAARRRAREQALQASARIAELAREALEAGIPKIEVARLAQVSRPALDAMLGKAEQEP